MKKILVVLSLVFTVSSTQSQQVVTLYGYLHIYPKNLGMFRSEPTNIISAINQRGDFGYNEWRLPTVEEIEAILANKEQIQDFVVGTYMSQNGKSSGLVRLVCTGKTVAEKEAEQQRQLEIQRANEAAAERRADAERQAAAARTVTDAGVDIGGVIWATRNVGAPGKFVDNELQPGGIYTWNVAQNACPPGWRLPTKEEVETLASFCSEIKGYKEGIRINNSLFFPGDYLDVQFLLQGTYWCYNNNTPQDDNYKYDTVFCVTYSWLSDDNHTPIWTDTWKVLLSASKLHIRCVKQ